MHLDSGVATRADLMSAGRDRQYGDRLVRSGRWTRAAPSTYLADPDELLPRIHAALGHAGPDAVLTGWAGCVALELPYVTPATAVDVLVPAGRRRVTTAYVRVLPTTRPPRWWLWGDIRVAAPTRCVIDAARALRRLDSVRSLVLGARTVASRDDMLAELEAGARDGRALVGRALRDLEHGAWSCPEAELADLVGVAAASGTLPQFVLNPDVLVRGRLLGRPDGWFPGLSLGWEVDSREHHGSADDLDATLARHDVWLSYGLSLLHVTPRRLRRAGTGYLPVLAAAAARHRGRQEPDDVGVRARGPLLPLRRRRAWPQSPS